MRGVYSFIAPNGNKYTVTYVADENGFHPLTKFEPKATTEKGPGVGNLCLASMCNSGK